MKERFANQRGQLSYFGQAFFGVQDRPAFAKAVKAAFACLFPNWRRGIFTGDNLVTFGKNLSFLTDERFMATVEKNAGTEVERSII